METGDHWGEGGTTPPRRRRKDRTAKVQQIAIDPEIWKLARITALLEGISVSEFVERLLRAELGEALATPETTP